MAGMVEKELTEASDKNEEDELDKLLDGMKLHYYSILFDFKSGPVFKHIFNGHDLLDSFINCWLCPCFL